ncbi:MAG: hypothetical protein HDQ87_08830 [Clostridia bacterium]|nr:hypothetical protein [Clostridia bacterium]
MQVEQINTSEMMRILGAAKNRPSERGASAFEQVRRAEVEKVSQEQDIEWFRTRIMDNLEAMNFDHSVVNGAVDITAEGLQAMSQDRSYTDQIMNLIRHDFSSSYSPRSVSVHVSVGATLDEYRVDTWAAADEAAFKARTADSFYVRTGRSGSSAASLVEFTRGLFNQFRSQLHATHAASEERAVGAGGAAREYGMAVLQYEANNAAYGRYGAYARQAYEG